MPLYEKYLYIFGYLLWLYPLLRSGLLYRSAKRTLTACNDINLNVYKGKTLGIVGESGCGKSTFVRMVISLDKPTSGEILYHGKNLADLSKKETW